MMKKLYYLRKSFNASGLWAFIAFAAAAVCPTLAGPVTSVWAVVGPDDTVAVAAAPLAGWYAAADSYEDNIEIRDVNQTLVHTISRADITVLLPWMDLNGSEDGPDALAFSDSGRLLFIGVHDANSGPGGQPSDAILRYDTQTGDLGVFARVEIQSTDSPWPHNAMAFYKGALYVGLNGGITVYRAAMNDLTGVALGSTATVPGAIVHGLAVDRAGPYLYAGINDTVYRAPITGNALSFNVVGSGLGSIRALAYSDHYGGAATPGLYVLDSTTVPAFGRVWYIAPSQARGQLPYSPSTYLVQPTNFHDMAATADGKLLIGADEDAVLVTDTSDTRLSFEAWKVNEFAQVVQYARGLIAPDPGELPGMVIDADVAAGGTRFHPATPDAACWTVLLLLINAEINHDATAQAQVRTVLMRYAGLLPGGSPQRTADGIYRHWIDPRTGGLQSGWDSEFATMSTMKIVLAASRAAAYFPQDAQIQQAAHAIICGVQNWDAYVVPPGNRMYLTGAAAGGPVGSSLSTGFHEGMIFVSEAAAYGGPSSAAAYANWLNPGGFPTATLIGGAPVAGNQSNVFLPAFVTLYELLVLPEFRGNAGWQFDVRNLRASHAAWTDDNAPPFYTVFSAGTTASQWGGYHADSLSSHPGNVTTFTSLLAFAAGDGSSGPRTQEAVAAYNAYRRGAREAFATGASFLYRRSAVLPTYNPDSAGLPDVALGALGLAELLSPGSVGRVLGGAYVPCGPLCGGADFNGDGDIGTDQDIEAFFRCLAGNCCAACGTADFNGDGDIGTDQDIEAFFRVLAGGSC